MGSFPKLLVSLSRWIGAFREWRNEQDGGAEESSSGRATPGECYACTQAGAPAFHSTSCDKAHPPEWKANAGSSLIPIQSHRAGGGAANPGTKRADHRAAWIFGRVLDPRSKRVHRWNRGLILARVITLAIDPLFFYALSVGGGGGGTACFFVDGGIALSVTFLRTFADVIHLFHIWLQFRLAYISRESLVVGCGKLVWDARAVAAHYLLSPKRFWFDVFVILPMPQVAIWLIIPRLIREDQIKLAATVLLLVFLFQYLPKVYHCAAAMKRMQKVTGYIFGTIWWGFALNLAAYFIASHVAGGCWYVLAVQRVGACVRHECELKNNCGTFPLACSREHCYGIPLIQRTVESFCGGNLTATLPECLKPEGLFPYGIYSWALPVVSSDSAAVKILYPIFWGLITLSTWGNVLDPTSQSMEVIFSIIITLSGLMLFTLLVGNIQVFLHAVMSRKRKMQLRCRDMEWWMRRRQLPSRLRQRVRQYERQRWAAMRGEEEMEMIRDLPQGLRRDIKRYLCLDLIKQVPLFNNLDDLILDNICDRVKPIVFSKEEKVIREGDPVLRMVFILRGRLRSSQVLSKGTVATCMLGPGNFLGDELLSWCLRRPFVDRLPSSSATFECVDPAEGFSLDAADFRYLAEHFRYKFASERLKKTARHYSSNWRTWAAVNIQLAWRRHRARTSGGAAPTPPESGRADSDRLLRQYAAVFMSIRPHDHLE